MIIDKKSESGFTLIELLVIVAILAIVSAIAVPSWRTMIANNNIGSTEQSLRSSLQLARSMSISRGTDVFLTPAIGGFEDGWALSAVQGTSFNDCNTTDPAVALECLSVTQAKNGLSIAPAPATAQITFRANGQVRAAVTFTICDANLSDDITGTNMTLSTGAIISTVPYPDCSS